MKTKVISMLALGLCLAACEKEKGAGFTGIGPAASQSSQSGYALDFRGLSPSVGTSTVQVSDKPGR